ncbi:MAG: M4 family metallopeptidase [Synergistaceae bacterium]|nr:M4 family metallopeptidase [Synergistaceae bacterium]
MSNRKFCVLMCALSLVFLAVFSSGCGGGGGGGDSTQSLVDPNNPVNSQDVPAPTPDTPDNPAPTPDVPTDPENPDTPSPAPTPDSPDNPVPVLVPDSPDNPAPIPESPDNPVPVPTPDSPDNPAPLPAPDSPDNPAPVPASPDNPAPVPASPDNPAPVASGYTVTFNSNGGSNVASITVSADSTLTQPEDPTKTGNIFVGWYKDSAFNEPFVFGANGDKVNSTTTLYAQWIDDDPAGFAVDDAMAGVEITYAEGDNQDYVTQNLGLPANSEGLPLTWTSNNPGVISAAGSVTRPSATAKVLLTAKAVSGDFEASKSFDLTVIKAHTVQAIASVDIADIELMNESNDHFEIDYDTSSDVVRAVEGKFSDVKVENAEDALDAVQSVHEMLGIDDPYSESQLLNVAKDEYGAQYSFRQVHQMADATMGTVDNEEEIPVYGRTLMVSANSSGETDFLTSNYLPTERMGNLYSQYTADMAEDAAMRNYAGGSVAVVSADTQKVIYSLEDYEQRPVIAFTVRVTGQLGNGDAVDDTVIVSGVDLSIIRVISNNADWTVNDSGNDELGNRRTFPVTKSWKWLSVTIETKMKDSGSPEVIMYQNTLEHENLVKKSGSTWNDPQQISFYANMRPVIKWWKDKFGRNSLDNKGMKVKLVAHERKNNWSDNAYWSDGSEGIFMCDVGANSTEYEHSFAVVPDVLAHESTHGVIYYITGGTFPYENATGAINEAYADVFGCMYDEEWQIGRRVSDSTTLYFDKSKCLRDIAADTSVSALSNGTLADVPALYNHYKTVPQTRGNDHNGVHTYSRLIAHASYLMHRDSAGATNGLSWYETQRVWYKSLFMGLDATSDFQTVRRNVLRAAQQIGLSNAKLRSIRHAFDAVGIYGHRGTIRGRVSDYATGGGLEQGGASVVIRGGAGLVETSGIVSPDGTFSFNVDTGNYTVQVGATFGSYRQFQTRASVVNDGDEVYIRAAMVKTGTGSADVRIVDYDSGNNLSGASLTLVNDLTKASVSGTTDSSGSYVFRNLASGYYTLNVSKSGYDSSKYTFTVPPSETARVAKYLYTKTNWLYKAVLDLDGRSYIALYPNLKANLGGTKIHVDKDNPTANAPNGRQAASYGEYYWSRYRWITFTDFKRSSYAFYVKWESTSDVDWNSQYARVVIFHKGRYLKKYDLPDTDSNGQYWNVFSINNKGVRKDINTIVADEPDV